MSAPERKFEYKRLIERDAVGPDGILERLGAEGWQLMDVSPDRRYLLMREVTKEEPFRSVFEQMFGSRF